ncbi:hypothetical protein HW132_02195 [Brasilonema sp. CT11]|nr:hypothetical protein [Brasilonema sp. CT11]
MALKQITVRPSLAEYKALENWRILNEQPTESAAMSELLRRFFDGGYRRSSKYRITKVRNELEALLSESSKAKKNNT